MVGAKGFEPSTSWSRTRQTLEFAMIYIKRAAIDICHVVLTKQLTLSECQLPPSAASTIRKVLAQQ